MIPTERLAHAENQENKLFFFSFFNSQKSVPSHDWAVIYIISSRAFAVYFYFKIIIFWRKIMSRIFFPIWKKILSWVAANSPPLSTWTDWKGRGGGRQNFLVTLKILFFFQFLIKQLNTNPARTLSLKGEKVTRTFFFLFFFLNLFKIFFKKRGRGEKMLELN